MIHTYNIHLSSPVGPLTLRADEMQISALDWAHDENEHPTALLLEARNQFTAYFEGKLKVFDLPLRFSGSPFQQDVCREMLKIPYGETRTYGDIAKTLNSSAQPVGGACGRNTIPILIPCHRVLGADDKMTGFSGAGGIKTKLRLLRHEGWQPKEPDLFEPTG